MDIEQVELKWKGKVDSNIFPVALAFLEKKVKTVGDLRSDEKLLRWKTHALAMWVGQNIHIYCLTYPFHLRSKTEVLCELFGAKWVWGKTGQYCLLVKQYKLL